LCESAYNPPTLDELRQLEEKLRQAKQRLDEGTAKKLPQAELLELGAAYGSAQYVLQARRDDREDYERCVEKCRCKAPGTLIPWDDGRRITFDVTTGMVKIEGGGPGRGVLLGGAGLVVLGGGIALSGGGGATTPDGQMPAPQGTPPPVAPTPDGTYGTLFQTEEGQVHEGSTLFHTIRRLILQVQGAALTIRGDAPWVLVSGAIDPNGNFLTSGTGTVAGFPNRPVTFMGNVSNNRLTGNVRIEGLPPNPPFQRLAVTGTKQ
jgi:hypothetical protein